MFVLLDIAPIVEELYGSARFFSSTWLWNWWVCVQHIFWPGIVGGRQRSNSRVAWSADRDHDEAQRCKYQAMRSRLISWVITIFVFGFLVPGIDNWAISEDGGGLRAGKGLCRPFAGTRSGRTRSYVLGWLAGGVLIASFVLMFLHFGDTLPQ